VALREFLFFPKFAESVAYDHAAIIPPRGLEGKRGAGLGELKPESQIPYFVLYLPPLALLCVMEVL
jgi:hypothetical protein